MGLNIDHAGFLDGLDRVLWPPGPQPVDTEIAGDPVQPGAYLGTAGLPVERLLGKSQQRFLGDVFRLRPVVQPVPREGDDGRQVTCHQHIPGR